MIAIEVSLLFCEYENSIEGILDDLNSFLKHKKPIFVYNAVLLAKIVIHNFGWIPLKKKDSIVFQLNHLFQHPDKKTRDGTIDLCIELYHYMKNDLYVYLKEIKPIQLKELTLILETITESPSPLRHFQSFVASSPADNNGEAPLAESCGDEQLCSVPVELVPDQLSETVVISTKLNDAFYKELVVLFLFLEFIEMERKKRSFGRTVRRD
jgi:hypothetical protein